MSKLLETIHLETEFDFNQTHSITEAQKLKILFNQLLSKLPHLSKEDWEVMGEKLGVYQTIGSKSFNAVTVYKVGSIHLLTGFAKKYGWQLAKDGNYLYIYDEKYWIEIDDELVMQFLKQAANNLGVPMWIASDVSFVKYLFDQIKLAGFFEKMNHDGHTKLNCKNTTVHITPNGIETKPFNPQDFLTHQLDFDYDFTVENKLWLDFLDTVLPDKDTQKTLQEALGYLLTTGLKLEKALFLYGTGSNGKSVIFEVLHGLLHSSMFTNYSVEDLTNQNGYARTNIHNKLINYGTDISMKKIDHGIFKQLISGEPVSVRQIYEKPFVMKKYAKLVFNLNRIDDADVESTIGFFRRMVFVPFEVTIKPEQQDKKLHNKILKNKAGVFNWILEGTRRVLANKEIFISKKCEDFLEAFRQESNLAIRFINEYNIQHSTKETVSFQELYEKFITYCKYQGENALSQRMFNNELKKLEYKYTRRSAGNVWYIGIDRY